MKWWLASVLGICKHERFTESDGYCHRWRRCLNCNCSRTVGIISAKPGCTGPR